MPEDVVRDSDGNPLKVTVKADSTTIRVHKAKGLITFSPGWRHPIRHWKLRHLRKDIRETEKRRAQGDPVVLLMDEVNRQMDKQFFYGRGGEQPPK